MTPSVADILRALDNPHFSFNRLREVKVIADSEIIRNSAFTECVVEWQRRRWILCCPTSEEVIHNMEQTIHHIVHSPSRFIAECEIFRSEMCFIDSMERPHKCDIVMQHLPDGLSLDKAAMIYPAEMLIRELNNMQQEFARIGFSHNALKAQNIILTRSGHLMVIQLHHASFNGNSSDDEAFALLRDFVGQHSGVVSDQLSDYEATYSTSTPCVAHDGMIIICEDNRYGYADADANIVIAPRFDKAGDFHEGRAIVEIKGKVALIDKQGNYILEPHYDHIEFDEEHSLSLAHRANRWHAFDYHGNALCPSRTEIARIGESLRNKYNITIEI